MFRYIITTLLPLILFCNHAFACSCYGPLNFCETVLNNHPDLVAHAVKKSDVAHGMEVEILEVLVGAENRQQVTVWGDNGLLCRHYAAHWNVGDTVIFALDLIGHFPALPQEDSTDYYISVCGTYFLDYNAGQVTGAINGADTATSYASWKNSLTSCITGMEALNNALDALHFFPNPAEDFVEISLPISVARSAQIRLFDVMGSERSVMVPRESDLVRLNTSGLAPGIYFLNVKTGTRITSRKLMIR